MHGSFCLIHAKKKIRIDKRELRQVQELEEYERGGERVEEIGEAMKLAMEKFKEEYGEDAKLEDGDEFVTIFNKCAYHFS